MVEIGEPKFRAAQIFSQLHKGKNLDEMTNIGKATKEKISVVCHTELPKVKRKLVSKLDGTVKYLFELSDGNTVEIELDICYEKVFKKGDKIIRLSGMKYPVDLTPGALLICPFCGNVFPTENDVCVECCEPAFNADSIAKAHSI